MPRFFFDIVQIDGTYIKDTVGADLADIQAAKEEAKRCLAEMSSEAVYEGLSELRVELKDATGNKLATQIAYFVSEEPDA